MLLIATLSAIFLALVMVLYFARRFVAPVLSLAEGARAVAQGDFSQTRPVFHNDEFGHLIRLFNHMTGQLVIAKEAGERNRLHEGAIRYYLECVLESLTTNVITLDTDSCLKTFSEVAEQTLDVSPVSLWGSNWYQWHGKSPQQTLLADMFTIINEAADNDKSVQVEYAAPDDTRILLGKTTILSEGNDNSAVMAIDDITVLICVQEEATWGGVARRLAHEVHNPLTPVQLSVEGLAWKLHDKPDGQSTQILSRSTDTIARQIATLKEMVEALRNYARAPSLNLEKQDLNGLVSEVLVLYEAGAYEFNAWLSADTSPIAADTTVIHQVLHDLLKNAVKATELDEAPQINVEAGREDGRVFLTVCNNGRNFSREVLHNVFEPYVTSKPTGTGLGLPAVKKIIEEHGGRISLSNQNGGGVCVEIALPRTIETYTKQ